MKKIIALALSLVLCISVFAAVAETPSITMSDLVKAEYTNPVNDGFALVLADVPAEGWIAEKVATLKSAADLDPEAVAAAGGAADWEINEAFAIAVAGVEESTPDVGVTLSFPTQYNAGAGAGVVITFADNSAVGIPATANEDGTISATFEKDLLDRLASETALLTVINAPAN